MISKRIFHVFAIIALTVGLWGCGGGSGPGVPAVDPVAAEKSANKAAVATIADFAEKLQEVKFLYFLTLTKGKDTANPEFLPLDLTISYDDYDTFMSKLDQLYKMEDEVTAAFAQLGFNKKTSKNSALIAPIYSANGIGEFFGKALGFRAKEANDVADALDVMSTTEKDAAWNTIKSSTIVYNAKSYDEWYAELRKGTYNYYANDIHEHLKKNLTDSDGMPIYQLARDKTGKSTVTDLYQTGKDALNNTVDIAKIAVGKVNPIIGTTITVIDIVNDLQKKPVSQVIKEQIKGYALGKIGLKDASDAYNTFVSDSDKVAMSLQRSYETQKMSNPATDVPANTSGLGAVTLVDKAGAASPTEPALVVMNNTKATLPDGEYAIILDMMAGTTPDDRTIPAPPGNYDVIVVNPDGVPGISQPVAVVEKQISVAVVDTVSVDPVPPTPEEAKITATINPAAVLAGGEATMTIKGTETVIAPLQVAIANPNSALMAAADKITNETMTVTATGNQLAVNLAFDFAKIYNFTITVIDAIGETYSTTAAITVTDTPVVPPPSVSSATFRGNAVFTTDAGTADAINWNLTVTTAITLAAGETSSGPVQVTISGTGNGVAVSGTSSGTWVNGKVDTYGTLTTPDGPINIGFSGNLAALSSATFTGTINAFATDLHTFASNLIP